MKTKNSFKNMINTIVAMDNDLFLTVDDTTYDAWLGILGDFYKDDTFHGKKGFIKNALATKRNLWTDLNNFYNAHMA